MDANDLYAGLEVPPARAAAKRQSSEASNREEAASSRPVEDAAVSNEEAAQRPAKRQRVVELPETVDKLKRYMLVDKKFAKASALFTQLINEKLSADTKELFLAALAEMIDTKGSQWSGRQEFAALIKVILSKKAVLLDSKDSKDDINTLLDRWEFLAVTHAQLFTDDTYQFVKAAKEVKLRLERTLASQSDSGADDDDNTSALQKTLHSEFMPPLRTIHGKLNVAWASSMVETVLAVCTRHRLTFSAADRETVDAWTKSVRDRRNAPAVARSASSDARRNIVAIDASNASQAKVKVGRSNHPLFNKG